MRACLIGLCAAQLMHAAPAYAMTRTFLYHVLQPTMAVADIDYRPAQRLAQRRRYFHGEWYTPGQHWQPWLPGRYHRYSHGGFLSAYCSHTYSVAERRCVERHW